MCITIINYNIREQVVRSPFSEYLYTMIYREIQIRNNQTLKSLSNVNHSSYAPAARYKTVKTKAFKIKH